MTEGKVKRRPLRCYLSEFKKTQTRCIDCHARLNRVSLMLDGVKINKSDISNLSQRLDESEWSTIKATRLVVLCRFCSKLHSPPLPVFFDLVDFQRYLLFNSSMNPSAVREYIIRLRRIDTLLVMLNVNIPRFSVTQIKAILVEHYSGRALLNMVPALNRYAEYVIECVARRHGTQSCK